MQGFPFVFFGIAWVGAGVLGQIILYSNAANSSRASATALFALPHCVIFGPLFLLLALTSKPMRECPHCRSEIHREATACSECTRDVGSP